MTGEPVMTVGAIVAVVTAGLQFLRLMGWIDWTDDQFNQFMVFVSLLLPILGGLWVRRVVTPLSDPKVREPVTGTVVPLVRADTLQPPTPPGRKTEMP